MSDTEDFDERTPLLTGGAQGINDNGKIATSDATSGKSGDKKEEKPTPRGATLAELFSFATCWDKFLLLWGILSAFGVGAAWPVMMLVLGDMTNDFVNYAKNGTENTTHFSNGSESMGDMFEDRMTTYALRYTYIGCFVCVTTFIRVACWSSTCERQTTKLRKAFFKALLRQDISWYDKQQSGDLTNKLADDLERIREGIGDKPGIAIQFISQFIAGFVIGFIKGWKLTLVIMSLTPLMAICSAFLGKLTVNYTTQEQVQYSKAGAVAEEVLSCIRTVTSFSGQKEAIVKYSAALAHCMKLGTKKSLTVGLSIGMLMLIMFSSYGLAFWYGSTQVNEYNISNGEDGYTPGQVLTIFFSVLIGSFAVGNAAPHITAFLSAKGAGGTIFPIIKSNPLIDSSDPGGAKPSSFKGHVELKDVGFTYPTRPDAKILKDFNLEIKPGQTVALVGASGCGKSTVVNLIQRFYDADEGNILVDGMNIKDLNIQFLREKIGIVSQEPILFGMTIAKNIELGQPDISMDEIEQAAKMANAHGFISQLPNGYNTLVGERGAQLSGGQKQRVAIARALVRDPTILLLDEATSALDSESEGIVQAALDKAGVGRTTIIIAHRLSTIQNADVIYVVEEGQVVESGKHADLMAKEGAYFKLVTLQTISEADTEEGGTIDDVSDVENPRKKSFTRGTSTQEANRKSIRGKDKSTTKNKNLFAKKKPQAEAEDEEEEAIEKPGFGRIFKSNVKELPFIIFGCLGAILNGAILPLFAVFFSEIIKTFGKEGDELLEGGLLWSMLFVALGVSSFIANLIQSVALGVSGERLTHRLRSKVFTNIVRQDIEYFDDPKHSTGALTTRLATDASAIKGATGMRLGIILQAFTSMVAGLTIALVFGWKLALAIIAGIPLIGVAGMLNMKLLKGNQSRDSELLEEAGKTAGECVENIRTVQGLTREKHFYDYYCDQLVKPHKENMKQAIIYGLSFAFSQGIMFFMYAGAFRFGAWLVTHDGMEPDKIFRVFFSVTFTGMAIGQASSFLPDYSKAQLSASKIFTILDIVPKIDIFSQLGTKKTHSAVNGKIVMQDIHFRYPFRPDVEVLKGVSLGVLPGQTVALVGVSGCGKSTIMSLLQRFYDPEAGSVLIEDMDIKDYNLKSLRSMISVVSQEPVLFDTTIKENILYGLGNELSMADVIEAARTANAHDFISKLPDGYETTVGEKGTQLSGGQKQRVAIARALIRNPKILLLDEATSALDTESEKIVQAALDRAREGRTCIMIAHRLSTVQNADMIYVMEDGQVLESGTHQELLAKKGAYAVLVGGQQFKKSNES